MVVIKDSGEVIWDAYALESGLIGILLPGRSAMMFSNDYRILIKMKHLVGSSYITGKIRGWQYICR